MLKRQTTLRLNADTEAETEWIWRSIPASSQQQIVELLGRMIGRAARQAASESKRERDTNDEHHQRQ
jgi:hypothetical protein